MELLKDEITPQEVVDSGLLLDRPVMSPLDVAYTYGALYSIGLKSDGEYQQYLSPSATADQIGDGKTVVATVDVDLTDRENPVIDGVSIYRNYSVELMNKLNHSEYYAARGNDNSITHQCSASRPEDDRDYLMKNIKRPLGKWPSEDAISRVADDHSDGWIIQKLDELSQSDNFDEIIDREVSNSFPEDETGYFIVSCRVKLPGDDDYRWPCDVVVFNEAMKLRKSEKYAEKGTNSDYSYSASEGECSITGEEGKVVGFASDPFNMYTFKQEETFQLVNRDNSVENRPIHINTASIIDSGEEFLGLFKESISGVSQFAIPYFTTSTPETWAMLYNIIRRVETERESNVTVDFGGGERSISDIPLTKILDIVNNPPDGMSNEVSGDNLRIYSFWTDEYQDQRWNFFGESIGGSTFSVKDLIDSHRSILNGWWVGDVDSPKNAVFSERNHEDESEDENKDHAKRSLLNPYPGIIESQIGSGYYFNRTLPTDDPGANDVRVQLSEAMFGGSTVALSDVIDGYVKKLIDYDNVLTGKSVIAEQFIQLCALDSVGIISGSGYKFNNENMQMENEELTRREKLEQFLNDSPAIGENNDVKSVFLLGVLVGRMSSYQRSIGKGTTIAQQTRLADVTQRQLQRISTDVLDKTVVYPKSEGLQTDSMYADITEMFIESTSKNGLQDLDLTRNEIRFWYAQGVSYGLSDSSQKMIDSEKGDGSDDETTAATME